jgi:AcrR family transcriptional regulator
MPGRKEQLLDTLVDCLIERGLNDLSLRPLAAAAGTSARLLVYHFGSKEGLLAEVLERMHLRLRQSFLSMSDEPQRNPTDKPLKTFWRWAISGENYRYLKLLYELQILAAQNPDTYGKYLHRNSAGWVELAKAMLPEEERGDDMATLLIAVFDGLFLELMSTGDRARTTAALDRFISIVENARRLAAAGV